MFDVKHLQWKFALDIARVHPHNPAHPHSLFPVLFRLWTSGSELALGPDPDCIQVLETPMRSAGSIELDGLGVGAHTVVHRAQRRQPSVEHALDQRLGAHRIRDEVVADGEVADGGEEAVAPRLRLYREGA